MSILPLWSSEEKVIEGIAEAIAWCAPRADTEAAATSLRSPEIAPPALMGSPASGVHSVVQARSFHLQEASVSVRYGQGVGDGRLLAFAIGECLKDGAVGQATNGYFDRDDIPPWDTWVTFVDETEMGGDWYLVSWVPPQFVSAVEEAFGVCSTDFLWWLDARDSEFSKILRARGVIR